MVVVVVVLEVLIVVLVAVARALVCARAVIDAFVEVLTIVMPVDVLIIVSDAAVDSLMAASTEIIRTVLASIGVAPLVGVNNVNALAGVTAAFEFVTSDTLDGFRC